MLERAQHLQWATASREVARSCRALSNLHSIDQIVDCRETIKKSRFVGIASPVTSPKAASEFLARFSDPTANHNCYAWRLSDGSSRSSNDGEPAGTAGPPILSAIERAQLHDVVLLVQRFFGGIKLGTGGLVRAYGGVASRTLEQAHMMEIVQLESLTCHFEARDTGSVYTTLARYSPGTDKSANDLSSGIHCVYVLVPLMEVESLKQTIARATNGRVHLSTSHGEELRDDRQV